MLALFESSAHPGHTVDRACEALAFLDNIIQTLALTTSDKSDANTFPSTALPHSTTLYDSSSQCSCAPPMYLPSLGREPDSYMMQKTFWDPQWTDAEIRREEIRRLCWSALTLAAGHSAHCAAFDREPLDLYLIQPTNVSQSSCERQALIISLQFAILFPDERLYQLEGQPRHSPKQSIWALYCRSMLLWNGCLRLRKLDSGNGQRAEYVLQAYMEMDEIKEAIESHVCSADDHLLYMAKEFLFKYVYRAMLTMTNLLRYAFQHPAHDYPRIQTVCLTIKNVGFTTHCNFY